MVPKNLTITFFYFFLTYWDVTDIVFVDEKPNVITDCELKF